jgi:hypothetical protein
MTRTGQNLIQHDLAILLMLRVPLILLVGIPQSSLSSTRSFTGDRGRSTYFLVLNSNICTITRPVNLCCATKERHTSPQIPDIVHLVYSTSYSSVTSFINSRTPQRTESSTGLDGSRIQCDMRERVGQGRARSRLALGALCERD